MIWVVTVRHHLRLGLRLGAWARTYTIAGLARAREDARAPSVAPEQGRVQSTSSPAATRGRSCPVFRARGAFASCDGYLTHAMMRYLELGKDIND